MMVPIDIVPNKENTGSRESAAFSATWLLRCQYNQYFDLPFRFKKARMAVIRADDAQGLPTVCNQAEGI
jgi:hypothetical protein